MDLRPSSALVLLSWCLCFYLRDRWVSTEGKGQWREQEPKVHSLTKYAQSPFWDRALYDSIGDTAVDKMA